MDTKITEVWVSDAMAAHHVKYLGTQNRRNLAADKMQPYLPTPEEVVAEGLEPTSYLDQFK